MVIYLEGESLHLEYDLSSFVAILITLFEKLIAVFILLLPVYSILTIEILSWAYGDTYFIAYFYFDLGFGWSKGRAGMWRVTSEIDD